MKKEYLDVLEGRRRYVGKQKEPFLEIIASDANRAHELAASAFRSALDHAKASGDALRGVAKRINGGRGRWTRWLTANFKASRETARVYMKVSRNWNDQRIILAREKGMEPTSIQSFLDILKGRGVVRQTHQWIIPDPLLETMRDLFVKKMKTLDREELDVLHDSIDCIWEKMYKNLQHTVCVLNETDYYCKDHVLEELRKRDVRSRGRRRLAKQKLLTVSQEE